MSGRGKGGKKQRPASNEPAIPRKKSKAEAPMLTWGVGDNGTILSDWRIIVTSNDEKGTSKATLYTVHKSVLGLGPRKSEYFLRLFQNKHVKEAHTSTSQLELRPLVAKAFPIMLDFMYTHPLEDKMNKFYATTETACALKHLADYFEIPTLMEHVIQFIGRDINLDNVGTYAAEAINDNDVYASLEQFAVDNRERLFVSNDKKSSVMPIFMEILPPEMRSRVLLEALFAATKNTTMKNGATNKTYSYNLREVKQRKPLQHALFDNSSDSDSSSDTDSSSDSD